MDANVTKNSVELLSSLGDNAMLMLNKLAVQLGITIDKIFPYYVKDTYIRGWGSLFSGLILSIFIGMLCIWTYKKMENSKNNYEQGWGWCFGISLFVEVIIIIMFICSIPGILSDIINPEYGAIQNIVKNISSISITPHK